MRGRDDETLKKVFLARARNGLKSIPRNQQVKTTDDLGGMSSFA
jgi:hypothetical protein